jgi:hypothetical protein
VASTAKATYIDQADPTQLGQATFIYKPAPDSFKKHPLVSGPVTFDLQHGTASLPVTLPGSGILKLGGNGIVKLPRALGRRSRSAGFTARKISHAGTYHLKIKAKGHKKHKLFATGKVGVKAVVTFKPTAGKKITDHKRIKLKYKPGA